METAADPAKRVDDDLYSELRRAEERAYLKEMRTLSDFAFVFLNGSEGDPAEAEALLDNFIDLLFEGNTLSLWRYRILLAQIREGL